MVELAKAGEEIVVAAPVAVFTMVGPINHVTNTSKTPTPVRSTVPLAGPTVAHPSIVLSTKLSYDTLEVIKVHVEGDPGLRAKAKGDDESVESACVPNKTVLDSLSSESLW